MLNEYRFHADAKWTGERRGEVRGAAETSRLEFSAPPEFNGTAGIWSSEDFFLAAVTSCFVTTFRAIAEFSKFSFEGLQVSAEGVLEKGEGGYRFTKIFVRPALTITRAQDRERALRLLEKAERACLISRSLQSEVVLEPAVVMPEPVTAR